MHVKHNCLHTKIAMLSVLTMCLQVLSCRLLYQAKNIKIAKKFFTILILLNVF